MTLRRGLERILISHGGVLAVLFLAQFVVGTYYQLVLSRIMVFAIFAIGYNVLFGYTGLLSLGHAMFFAAGLYGTGLAAIHLPVGVPEAFAIGIAVGFVFTVVIALVVLRTTGVAFMIVTLMFAQVAHLAILYFGDYTRGDEGFNLKGSIRSFDLFGFHLDLVDPATRFNLAFVLLAVCVVGCILLVRSPVGRVLVAIRENEERTRMLGYNTFRYKLVALVVSGTISAMAGSAYALLDAQVSATFASIEYSILPLLWVLLGGVGTVLGPIVGTLLMFYIKDFASEHTSAYLLVFGLVLVILILFAPGGLLGTLRERAIRWLP
jgi:branched-chain amino acid transport system permease protein